MSSPNDDLDFRPFSVLLGIILGTLFAVAFCTCIVGIVFWFLGDEAPRLAAELPKLIEITVIFIFLTAMAGLSFLGTLRRAVWRYPALVGLWGGLLLTGYYYWP